MDVDSDCECSTDLEITSPLKKRKLNISQLLPISTLLPPGLLAAAGLGLCALFFCPREARHELEIMRKRVLSIYNTYPGFLFQGIFLAAVELFFVNTTLFSLFIFHFYITVNVDARVQKKLYYF